MFITADSARFAILRVKDFLYSTNYMRWALALIALLVPAALVSGNDGAASTAASGIQLKKEARISMEKERLFISEKKITVDYEFE